MSEGIMPKVSADGERAFHDEKDIDKAIGDYIDGWIRIVRKCNRRWRRKCVRARKNRRGW